MQKIWRFALPASKSPKFTWIEFNVGREECVWRVKSVTKDWEMKGVN